MPARCGGASAAYRASHPLDPRPLPCLPGTVQKRPRAGWGRVQLKETNAYKEQGAGAGCGGDARGHRARGSWSAPAHAANTPLPAYPATTTLNLGSPNCVTDDVIMDDPLDSTSPITDTAGNAGAGSPVVHSQARPADHVLDGVPGQHRPTSGSPTASSGYADSTRIPGSCAAYNRSGNAPDRGSLWIKVAVTAPTSGTITYTVRDQGMDSLEAAGAEQFQVTVNDSGSGASEVTTVCTRATRSTTRTAR